MSDGFDKEAEREKLREKFAEDEQKREHTQRMSELLLQGATMTNRHCEACGDPIFRHDGQEFCPTCHATEDGYAVPADDEATRKAADDGAVEAGSASGADGAVEVSDSPGVGDPAGSTDATTGTPIGSPPNGTAPTPDTRDRTAGRQNPSGDRSEVTSPGEADSAADTADGAIERRRTGSVDGIHEARASLTRTLTRFARTAEETDDPRRAREHLEAAREAAATLAALDR